MPPRWAWSRSCSATRGCVTRGSRRPSPAPPAVRGSMRSELTSSALRWPPPCCPHCVCGRSRALVRPRWRRSSTRRCAASTIFPGAERTKQAGRTGHEQNPLKEALTSDPIDDLLDRSAPALADRGNARERGLAHMVRDARDAVLPPKRSRRRVMLLGGVLALLLAGGAGVATANSDWRWSPGLDNPDLALPPRRRRVRVAAVRIVEARTPPPVRDPS